VLTNARVVGALLRFGGRGARLLPLAGGAFVGLGVTALPAATSAELTAANHATLLRVVAVAIAIGAAFALDDPAARTTVVLPVTRLVRHTVRASVTVAAATVVWAAALLLTWSGATADVWGAVPVGGLTVEAATLVSVAVAGAAALRHAAEQSPGVLAAPVVLLFVAAAALLPGRAALFVDPGALRWDAVHRVWLFILIVAVALFVATSRDLFRARRGGERIMPRKDDAAHGADSVRVGSEMRNG
jgi:hypothetical protein